MDIFFKILSCIENNSLFVMFVIIFLCIFLIATIALLKNECKLDTLFFRIIDTASKFAQIIALIIGISYGYSAINTYDVKKMTKEKKELEQAIQGLNDDIHIMQALMKIKSQILEDKNNEVNELSKKISNLNSIIEKRENELKYTNKEMYILKHEISNQEAELDKQYKMIFARIFILENYNTIINIWIRHINGFNTIQDMEKKMNQYMPSPYSIITESLSTIRIYGIPDQKLNELKMLIYKEIENNISLHQQKFTYNEFVNSSGNGFIYILNHIRINKDGSTYINIPEDIVKNTDIHESLHVLHSLLDTAYECVTKAFKL